LKKIQIFHTHTTLTVAIPMMNGFLMDSGDSASTAHHNSPSEK